MIIELTSADLSADPRLDDYTRLKDVKLRSKIEPEHGLYMAESANVIERAIQAGHQPRSFLHVGTVAGIPDATHRARHGIRRRR